MDFIETYNAIFPRYPELAGQAALVTGAGRGIGLAIAMRLAREGMRVVLSDLPGEAFDRRIEQFRAVGAQVAAIPADLSQPGEPDRLAREALAAFGPPDVLVNNAADLRRRDLLDMDEAFFDYHMALNFKAPFLLAQRAAEAMRAAGKPGCILSISSVGGLRAHWRGQPYDSAKGAIDAMTRAAAISLAEHGIRVNAIAPGATASRQFLAETEPAWAERMAAIAERIPARRFASPLEIAAAAAFLASPEAAYITGQVLYVDGGLTAQLSPRGHEV